MAEGRVEYRMYERGEEGGTRRGRRCGGGGWFRDARGRRKARKVRTAAAVAHSGKRRRGRREEVKKKGKENEEREGEGVGDPRGRWLGLEAAEIVP